MHDPKHECSTNIQIKVVYIIVLRTSTCMSASHENSPRLTEDPAARETKVHSTVAVCPKKAVWSMGSLMLLHTVTMAVEDAIQSD